MGGTRCADGILRCRRPRKRGQRPHCPRVDADGTYRRRVRVVVDSSRVRQYRGTGVREREMNPPGEMQCGCVNACMCACVCVL